MDKNPAVEMDPLWYKEAIIYQLHVKAFFDSNDNGIGDFRGLTQKLGYVQDLGVNTLWLLPFYPSPLRDDGYDIADYRNVHADYGTMRDFREFVREAHRRGLRIVTELVINHTSDQHAWFQAARKAQRGSSKRSFYVWSDTDKRYADTRIIFTDTETSNWAWDPVAQQYYWHRFFSHQPDLNFDNPQVVKAVLRVMRFWLDAGVDGLRLDAVPYLCEREGTGSENLPETHMVLKRMRAELDGRYPDRMFLAEANQWPEDVRPYFGDGDECHMAFHFPVMPRIYMAVAQEDRHPIVEIMDQTPEIPDNCQWAIFLRNHDELTLEMVTHRERDYMYNVYAGDPRMRINLGIRRRLAPLMDNDMDKIKLLNNLLLSLPGSPIIYYGDELGMGDNIFLGDRNGMRTPMQWSPDRNAGFSRADPQRLYLPPIMDPVYGYEAVNIESQSRDPSSLLNWMKRIIAVRKAHRALGYGRLQFLRPGNRKVLAFLREHENDVILCVSNLSRAAQPVELDLAAYKGLVPVELMGRSAFPPIGDLPYLLTLPGYAFYWFSLGRNVEVPRWHEERLPPLLLPVLVLFAGWRTLFPDEVARIDPTQRRMSEKVRDIVEHEIWPGYVTAQRWFAAKGATARRVELLDHAEWNEPAGSWLMGLARVYVAEQAQCYFMPLAIAWEEGDEEHVKSLMHRAVARVRRGPRTGILIDAFADDAFCRAMVAACGQNRELECTGGRLMFRSTARYPDLVGGSGAPLEVRPLGLEQSNTSVILSDRLMLKGYRQLREGMNPELEVGRFLSEVSPFPRVAPIAGYLEYRGNDGTVMTLAIVQGFVPNQGDGWTYTLNYLEKYLEGKRIEPTEQRLEQDTRKAIFVTMMHQLGIRTGELHNALSKQTGDPAFDPEPVSSADLEAWVQSVHADALATFGMLERQRTRIPEPLDADVSQLLGLRQFMLDYIRSLVTPGLETIKTRHHGDYHLGQVLVVENDFFIIDFEGEPLRPLAERRAKHSPLKDVAGMLRSFDYAANTALQRITAERPEDLAILEPVAREWEREVMATFLEGYQQAATGAPYFPVDPDQALRLLGLFTIEKALYELRYEIDNRPDWVGIPIRGIINLMAREQMEEDTGELSDV